MRSAFPFVRDGEQPVRRVAVLGDELGLQLPFFRGTSLDPVPPKASQHDEMRYFDIHEDEDLDEDQLVSWIEQASNLPGEKM